MNFFRLCPPAFGLNITDTEFQAIQLKKIKTGFALSGFFSQNIEKGIIKDGEILQQDIFCQEIKKITKKSAITASNVIFSIPEFKTFLKIIDIPINLSQKETAEAVKWETEAGIPVPIEEVYIDWKEIPEYSNNEIKKVFLASAPKNLIDSYAETLRNAGFNPIAAEMESIALARVSIKEQISGEKAFLIINTNKTGSIFVIVYKNAVQFSSINIRIDLDFILDEAARALEFAKEHIIKSENIDVIISGGKDNPQNFPRIISEKLKTPILEIDPWIKIKKSKNQEKLSLTNSLITLGLAERAAQLEIW